MVNYGKTHFFEVFAGKRTFCKKKVFLMKLYYVLVVMNYNSRNLFSLVDRKERMEAIISTIVEIYLVLLTHFSL